MDASLDVASVGGVGSAIGVFRRYRVAHRARRRRGARGKSGCDRYFRSCRVRGSSFAGVPGASGSRLRIVSKRNGSSGDHDRRSGAGSGFQRRRRGPGLSAAARRAGAGSDRGDARLGYGAVGGAGGQHHARERHEELHCGERCVSRISHSRLAAPRRRAPGVGAQTMPNPVYSSERKGFVDRSYPEFFIPAVEPGEKYKAAVDVKFTNKQPQGPRVAQEIREIKQYAAEHGHLVVTMDGVSGSGKSTVAKTVAQKLGFELIDAGAFFRTVAYIACSELGPENINKEITDSDVAHIIDAVNEAKIEVIEKDYGIGIILNGRDISAAIRTSTLADKTAILSTKKQVLEHVFGMIRSLTGGSNLVCDGRNMGTDVFPDAQVKFYITADVKVQAERRFKEYESKGTLNNRTLADIEYEITARDTQDSSREFYPLRIAQDAIVADTSQMSQEEAVNEVIHKTAERIRVLEKQSGPSVSSAGPATLPESRVTGIPFIDQLVIAPIKELSDFSALLTEYVTDKSQGKVKYRTTVRMFAGRHIDKQGKQYATEGPVFEAFYAGISTIMERAAVSRIKWFALYWGHLLYNLSSEGRKLPMTASTKTRGQKNASAGSFIGIVKKVSAGKNDISFADLASGPVAEFEYNFCAAMSNAGISVKKAVSIDNIGTSPNVIFPDVAKKLSQRPELKRAKYADINYAGDLEKAGIAQGEMDVVTINNIVNRDILEPALSLLAPGGDLFITFAMNDDEDFINGVIEYARSLSARGYEISLLNRPEDYPVSNNLYSSDSRMLVITRMPESRVNAPVSESRLTLKQGSGNAEQSQIETHVIPEGAADLEEEMPSNPEAGFTRRGVLAVLAAAVGIAVVGPMFFRNGTGNQNKVKKPLAGSVSEPDFESSLAEWEQLGNNPAALGPGPVLNADAIEAIKDAAKQYNLDPYFVAAVILQEQEKLSSNSWLMGETKSLVKTIFSGNGSSLGLGQVKATNITDRAGLAFFEMLVNNKDLTLSRISDREKKDSFTNFIKKVEHLQDEFKYNQDALLGHLCMDSSSSDEDNVSLAEIESIVDSIDAVNVFVVAYVLRKKNANNIKRSKDIPNVKPLSEAGTANGQRPNWLITEHKLVPSNGNEKIDLYRNRYLWKYYPPETLYVFVANRYMGAEVSVRGLRTVEIYKNLLKYGKVPVTTATKSETETKPVQTSSISRRGFLAALIPASLKPVDESVAPKISGSNTKSKKEKLELYYSAMRLGDQNLTQQDSYQTVFLTMFDDIEKRLMILILCSIMLINYIHDPFARFSFPELGN